MNVFRDSSSSSVVLGKNNWLFFTDEGSIEDYKGTNLYTRDQLELIKDNILSTKAYLEARGIEFILMIPSNKEEIYSDNLPDYIRKRGEQTRAEQVISYPVSYTHLFIGSPNRYKSGWRTFSCTK